MALLNAGCILAQQGRRVLLVDFDLEAPGLTRLLEDHKLVTDHEQARQTQGVIDLFHQFIYAPEQFAFAVDQKQIDLDPYLVKLVTPKVENPFAQGGSLHLLPAGALEDYAKHLDEVTRRSQLVARVRKQLAERIRQVLVESGRFDYILIDARTGLSDEGYIAAKFMCDYLVVLTGLNEQNLWGTADFLTRVAAWVKTKQGPKGIVLVASPVPEYEDDAKDKRYEAAKQILGKIVGKEELFAVSLPYHPRVSLYEELVAHRWPESGLGRAYRRLTTILRDLNDDALADLASAAAGALRGERVDAGACVTALRNMAAIDRDQAVRLVESLSSALVPADEERAAAVLPLFDEFAQIDPEEPLHPLQKARAQRQLRAPDADVLGSLDQAQALAETRGDSAALAGIWAERAEVLIDTNYAGARDAALTAAGHARELSQRDSEASALHMAARADRVLGDYRQAREHLAEALAIKRDLGDRRGISITLNSLAILDTLQGRYDEARRGFQEALAIMRDLDDPRETGITLHSLAELNTLQGRYNEARKGFQEALAIARDLGDRRGISATLHSLARLDRLQGRYDEARRGFEEALAIMRDLDDPRETGTTLHSLAQLDTLQGRYDEARKGFQESLAIARELRDQQGIGVTLHSLAGLDTLQGRYDEARKGFEEALAIERELGDPRGVTVTRMYLEAVRAQADLALPLDGLAQAVRVADDFPDPHVAARAHFLIGAVLRQRGEYEDALAHLGESLGRAAKSGFRDLSAMAEAERALCFDSMGKPEEAEAAARSAIAFFDEQHVEHAERDRLDGLARGQG